MLPSVQTRALPFQSNGGAASRLAARGRARQVLHANIQVDHASVSRRPGQRGIAARMRDTGRIQHSAPGARSSEGSTKQIHFLATCDLAFNSTSDAAAATTY